MVSCLAWNVLLENLLSIGTWYMPYLRNRVSLVIVSLMMAKNYGLHSTAAVEIFSGFEPLMMIKRRARWLRNTRWVFFSGYENINFLFHNGSNSNSLLWTKKSLDDATFILFQVNIYSDTIPFINMQSMVLQYLFLYIL